MVPDPKAWPSSKRGALAVIAAGSTLLCGRAALGQDSGDVASVESESELVSGPQDLPGHDKGPRRKDASEQPVPPPAAEAPDWFGGKPWWEWNTATGDWDGIRTSLDQAGLALAGSFTLDWSGAWSGGERRRASTRSLTDVNLTAETGKLVGLEGGTFFVDFTSTDGRGHGDVGDLQGTSNIATERNLDEIAELWYEQWAFDKFIRIKIGKVDANAEFDFMDGAKNFLNAANGEGPSVLQMPTFPDNAVGINLFVYPAKWMYVGYGFYDGATADGFPTGPRGAATFFSDRRSSSWFHVGEAGVTWEDAAGMGKGRAAVGVWHHTADFPRFDAGMEKGTTGVYLLGEQQLVERSAAKEDESRGLFAFARYEWADRNVAQVARSIGAGLVVRGTFGDRSDDEAGLMISWAGLSDVPAAGFARDETNIEVYYRLMLTPFVAITPDLQYVVHPSGDPGVRDAVVGGVRLEVTF